MRKDVKTLEILIKQHVEIIKLEEEIKRLELISKVRKFVKKQWEE